MQSDFQRVVGRCETIGGFMELPSELCCRRSFWLCVGDNVSSPLTDEKVQGRMPLNESGTAEDLGFRLFWEAKAFPYLLPKGAFDYYGKNVQS